MVFEIDAENFLSDDLKKITLLLINSAYDSLNGYDNNPDRSIHKARIAFKKIRTNLRLLRNELGNSEFKKLNHLFRDCGLMLSDLRDDTVKKKILKKISSRAVGHEIDKIDLENFEIISSDKKTIQLVLDRLEAVKHTIKRWRLKKQEFELVKGPMKKLYRSGKKSLQVADSRHNDEDFHELRKRAKHLYYFNKLMNPVFPETHTSLDSKLSKFTKDLGDYHDLTILKNDLILQADANKNIKRILILIRQDQTQLREQTISLGKNLYAEKSDDYITRMESYYKTWKQNQ